MTATAVGGILSSRLMRAVSGGTRQHQHGHRAKVVQMAVQTQMGSQVDGEHACAIGTSAALVRL